MKYIFSCLYFLYLTAGAQSPEEKSRKENLQDFIYQKHMVGQGKKNFRLPRHPASDSLIKLNVDSLTFLFSISELSSMKTKDYKTYVKYRKRLETLRKQYADGVASFQLEEADGYTEKLLADAILKGKAEQLLVADRIQSRYTCYSYGFSRKGKPALFALHDKQGCLFWSYTYVICFGIRFR